MWRNVIIAAAGLLGAVVLYAGYQQLIPAPAAQTVAEAAEATEVAEAAQQMMRLCLGPARVTFGGEPFVGLAFGGDGCSANAANLVGFRIFRKPSLPGAPTLTSLLPL
jgi:hypothetical protein